MKYDDLKEYFYRFVHRYRPYKDDALYQVLTKFLEESFFKDSYENIPEKFKTLFEEHTLSSELYDIVLESLGYPKDIIQTLPSYHKEILLSEFPNPHENRATLGFVRKLLSSFLEPINLYEMYIDFKHVSGDWDWWFVPKSVYTNVDIIQDPMDYDEVYHSVPTYFLSKQQLHNWFLTESITLPIKSNLLLLNMATSSRSDEMYSLIVSTVLFHFKDFNITLVMDNGERRITLNGLYQLWHYLLFRYRGAESVTNPDGKMSYFDISGNTFPYTLEKGLTNSIDTIVDEYDQLKEPDEIWEFYLTKIKEVFSKNIPIKVVTLKDLERNLIYTVDVRITNEIKKKIDSATDVQSEITSILQDLKLAVTSAILESDDALLIEYAKYIQDSLELSMLQPTRTTTFKLLDYFKPFHTRIITASTQITQNKSKFNTAGVLDHYRMFVIRDFPATCLPISDDLYFCERIESEFTFTNSDEVITDEVGASVFKPGNQIFSRPMTGGYPIDNATLIDEIIAPESGSVWTLKLNTAYPGATGTFNFAYRRYHHLQE